MLAALVICVGYMCVLWCLTGTWCYECLLQLAYVLAICLYGGARQAPSHICWLYVCVSGACV